MKKVGRVVLSLAVAAGAFAAGARWSHGAKAGAEEGRKVLYYVDPMHPAYRSEKPGIAPDCGMQLEPVYADGAAAESAGGPPERAGTVHVPGERQQLIGVRVSAVERTPTTYALRLLGRVVPDEARLYTVNAAVDGSFREVSPVTTGSRVKKGQWLATFFSESIRTPMQAYITALDVQDRDPIARKEAGINLAAGSSAASSAQFTVERLKGLGMSQPQIDEIRRLRQVPLTVRVVSPADGFVLARNVSLGQKFDKGMEWYRIADLDKVWILADATEEEARWLRPGLEVKASLPRQGRAIAARVTEILPQFDAGARSLKVRLEADNPGYELRPDMFVDLSAPVVLPAATAVPVDALIDSGTRKTVFVERAAGVFEPREVETGWQLGDKVEVVKGLAAGERVVVSGTFLVDSESRLRAAAAGVYGAAARDPVCGMEVDEAKARAAGKTLERDGKTFAFCSQECRHRFEQSPERYAQGSGSAAHEREHEHDRTALR